MPPVYSQLRSDARPLLDSKGRVFLVLAGQPTDNGYPEAVSRAYDAIKKEGMRADFPPDMRNHRRGLFAAMSVGLILGQGQKIPTWLDNGDRTDLAQRLLANEHIARMAHYASFAFSLWAPRLYSYYVNYNARLTSRFSHLKRPFLKSVFSCAGFNFGPRVCTFKHRDVCNLPFGWCAVQALGRFDPQAGATIAHSNIPVADDEERISFTQFTAGGLFRFVDNGFRTQAELAAQDPVEYARMVERNESRWEEGLQLFSTISELVETK
ncbi:hypothetical protein K438DRAFT_1910574 [Mycena galopus ATCC 62051]|nr:hypothetical protein K438DRAFT_1910574 [Mycena galopus ATCC 62051]